MPFIEDTIGKLCYHETTLVIDDRANAIDNLMVGAIAAVRSPRPFWPCEGLIRLRGEAALVIAAVGQLAIVEETQCPRLWLF